MEINWTSIISITFTAVSLVVGIATAYLRLFVGNKINDMKDAVLKHIDEKFALKELVQTELRQVNNSISKIESRLDKFENRLDKKHE